MAYQIVLMMGIAGCYLFGYVTERLALSGAEQWDEETRRRLNASMLRAEGLLRLVDMAGIGLLVLGILRHYGMLRVLPLTASRTLVIAIAVLCLERVLRGWLTWRAFVKDGKEETRPRALIAALTGTALQVALASWVAWWVFTNVKVLPPAGRGTSGTGTTTGQTPGGSSGTNQAGTQGGQAPDSPWISEDEALRFLGKDKTYLELLVPYANGQFAQPLRGKVDGRVMYRRDNLEKLKEGGLPSIEELKNPPRGDSESEILQE